jgi:hypothetical protein
VAAAWLGSHCVECIGHVEAGGGGVGRGGEGWTEGLRASLVCLHPVTCLIHTFPLGFVYVSAHLIGFHLIPTGIACGEDLAEVRLIYCWISMTLCMLGCSARTQVMLGTVHLVGI